MTDTANIVGAREISGTRLIRWEEGEKGNI